jgi:PHD/YefM family antitoxin component YafN of YafNO toxin-antitoxin module
MAKAGQGRARQPLFLSLAIGFGCRSDSCLPSLTRAKTERIVISRRGRPSAVLVGIEAYDAEDLALTSSADFWQMIRERQASGTSAPLAEVERRLVVGRTKPARTTGPRRRGRKLS